MIKPVSRKETHMRVILVQIEKQGLNLVPTKRDRDSEVEMKDLEKVMLKPHWPVL